MKLGFANPFVLFVALAMLLGAASATAQTSSFTYQGRLTDGGTAANGNYDLQFALWDSLSGGSQIGSTQTLNIVADCVLHPTERSRQAGSLPDISQGAS